MRRTIDGKVYNTTTATKVASTSAKDGKAPFRSATLYLNRDGRYFLHYERASLLSELAGMGGADEAICLLQTPAEVAEFRKQVREYTWHVHDDPAWNAVAKGSVAPLGKCRKADPSRGEAAFTLRLPRSLKARVASAAEAEGMSVNAYIMRSLESGLAGKGG